MIKCILISFLLCITFSQMGKGNTNESQIQDIESSIIISTQEKGSNNIVVFLTIQYYCLSLRHE